MMKQWNNLKSPHWVRLWKRQRTWRRARVKVRIGAWNVRALGAPHAEIDQMVKMRKLVRTWERRRWRAVCLSDVRWPIGEEAENSIVVRAFKGRKGWWTIIHCGKVAIALCSAWAEAWRRGGAHVTAGRGAQARCLHVALPRKGW